MNYGILRSAWVDFEFKGLLVMRFAKKNVEFETGNPKLDCILAWIRQR